MSRVVFDLQGDYTAAEVEFRRTSVSGDVNPETGDEGNGGIMGIEAKEPGSAGNDIEITSPIFTDKFLTGGRDAYFNALDGDTITIGSKVYTFQETLTDVDGNVHIGDGSEGRDTTLANLVAAINLDSGAGTAYAASMTEHPLVSAFDNEDGSITVTAKESGDEGNEIDSLTDISESQWTSDTLTGGFTALFLSDPGFTGSAVLSAIDSGIQGVTIELPDNGELVERIDLNKGIFHDAQATLWICNWADPSDGAMVLFAGTIGNTEHDDDDMIVLELNGLFNRTRRVRVESYSAQCRADLGDDRCRFDIEEDRREFTITAVNSDFSFETDNLDQADDFWKLGVVQFLSGNNEGVAIEVKSSTEADNSVSMFTAAPFELQIGDTGQIWPGCDKTLETCLNRFDNVINFVGEPFNPTEDTIYEYEP